MPADSQEILGRSHGDADKLFPRYTVASAATTGEVEVNGKVLHLWEYAQLEPLSTVILRKRATALRDAIGANNCPPIPCGHSQNLIRYILEMQAQVTNQSLEVGPSKIGSGSNVPVHFMHETKGMASGGYPDASKAKAAPFGPRTADHEHRGKRDSFRDLIEHKKEFEDPEPHMNLGIETLRPGGEGRKHFQEDKNIEGCSITPSPKNTAVGGRKYLGCKDSVSEHRAQLDAAAKGLAPHPTEPIRRLAGGPPDKHVSNTKMAQMGIAEPEFEPHIGGERKRHIDQQHHMLHIGTSNQVKEPNSNGRRHLEAFGGPRQNHSDAHASYRASWRKDPSRLHGTSLII
eukprot:TRINITY_DN73096_c0_g1_i1.p1 TRINITY_DN73096_c0_g1~~TRINITY_DN73096_c0_g1_i1.p1  ORF type:complete len:345 (-),score=44.31 TRINITY_DN73096_c0_g1_i1:122-1156(-)